jgi:hypothetical protein
MLVTLIHRNAAGAAVMSFCHFAWINPYPFIARRRLAAERFGRLAGKPEMGFTYGALR